MLHGIHSGDFMNIASTQKEIAISGSRFDRVRDGKIIEHWSMFDFFSLIQKIQ